MIYVKILYGGDLMNENNLTIKELIDFFQKAPLEEITEKLKQYGVKFTDEQK